MPLQLCSLSGLLRSRGGVPGGSALAVLRFVGERFAELAFEDLAGGVARQVVHEEDVLGYLEAVQVLAGVGLGFFGDLDGGFRSLGSSLLAPALADILGEGCVLAHR